MKRTNPRRVPATKADVEKAKQQATADATRQAILLILYVLEDKHNASKEDLNQFAQEINYMADSVARGYVKWSDIERVLLKEYEIEIDF